MAAKRSAVEEILRLQSEEVERARKNWQARADRAAAAIKLPKRPYRIVGVAEDERWYIERAVATHTPPPSADTAGGISYRLVYSLTRYGRYDMPDDEREAYIAALAADVPTAALEWERVRDADEDDAEGFYTFARARRWLREWLEPCPDCEVYFDAEGGQESSPPSGVSEREA